MSIVSCSYGLDANRAGIRETGEDRMAGLVVMGNRLANLTSDTVDAAVVV
jgi:hypothetical protein